MFLKICELNVLILGGALSMCSCCKYGQTASVGFRWACN